MHRRALRNQMDFCNAPRKASNRCLRDDLRLLNVKKELAQSQLFYLSQR